MSGAQLAEAYSHCDRIARAEAKHFYWGFRVLPKERRLAMSAVYAFARQVDDIADDDSAAIGVSDRQARLAAFREDLRAAILAGRSDHPVLMALVDTIARFSLTPRYLEMILDGAQQDLHVRRYPTVQALQDYCRLVASSVGLICLELLDCRDEKAKPFAEELGIALQLTNILRDVREDAGRGRIYLPQEDLIRTGCREEDILSGTRTEAFLKVCAINAARARAHYENAHPLLTHLSAVARRTVSVMAGLYATLLSKIEAGGFEVLERRVALSKLEKTLIFLGVLFRPTYSVKT